MTQTRSLLQLPGTDSTSLYTDADLIRWINIARGQLAGEAECIRVNGVIRCVVDQNQYSFSDISLAFPPVTLGVDGVIHVRSIRYGLPGGIGSVWVPGRPWEWYELYFSNNTTPSSGPPEVWSQYGQGAAPGHMGSSATGSFFIAPAPDSTYPLVCDCVCFPIKLVDNTTAEAISYLFTDAVPFFAAYYALLSAQMGARYNDAIQYYKMYSEFMNRARKASNATPNRWQYEQAADPAQAAKMGVKAGGGM